MFVGSLKVSDVKAILLVRVRMNFTLFSVFFSPIAIELTEMPTECIEYVRVS